MEMIETPRWEDFEISYCNVSRDTTAWAPKLTVATFRITPLLSWAMAYRSERHMARI
jgi:hypothetical protein